MTDFPRDIGGGEVKEVYPGVLYFESLAEDYPELQDVVRFVDLSQTAEELKYAQMNAGRAFNSLIIPLRIEAMKQLLIPRSVARHPRQRLPWEYVPKDHGDHNVHRRLHLGVTLSAAAQVLTDDLIPWARQSREGYYPKNLNVIEAHLVTRGAHPTVGDIPE